MTEAESKIADAVARKLLGEEFRVGATVFTKKGRMCEVLKVRECATGGRWVRVRFSSGGHWEYHETELKLFGG